MYHDINGAFFNLMYCLSVITLAFLIWRSATDLADRSDDTSLRTELRFVAGSGIGGTIFALAASLTVATGTGSVIIILMSVAMLIMFASFSLFKRYAKEKVFNFTQCFLILSACFAGSAVYLIPPERNDQQNVNYALATVFLVGWVIVYFILVFRFLRLSKSVVDASGSVPS